MLRYATAICVFDIVLAGALAGFSTFATGLPWPMAAWCAAAAMGFTSISAWGWAAAYLDRNRSADEIVRAIRQARGDYR